LGLVQQIEEQLSQLDAGVAALRRAQANLKRYRASVLKAVVEGRFVPTEAELARRENREYETGEELLTRILDERRSSWPGKGKYKEPLDSSGTPDEKLVATLPEGWTLVSVGQLLRERLINGVSIKGSDSPPGVRALRLSAMGEHGFDYNKVRYLPLIEDRLEDILVAEGDFFVSRGNGSLHLVGRGTSAQAPPAPTIFPDTMIRLRLAHSIRETRWIQTIWSSRVVRSQIERLVKTTAGIYKISQPQVEAIVLPLPPLSEQERIVTNIERRLSAVDAIEKTLAENLKRATKLRQAVLWKAFSAADGQ
jgi:type I restriction enzyme S subunit